MRGKLARPVRREVTRKRTSSQLVPRRVADPTPTLHQWLKSLPWREVLVGDKTRATAHGRDEICRLKTATVSRIAFPHAAQVVQIVCRRRVVTTGKTTLKRVGCGSFQGTG